MTPANPLYVKVCGLKTPEAVQTAIESGADAIGFVHAPGSPRHLEPQEIRELLAVAGQHDTGCAVDTVLVVRSLISDDAARLALNLGVSVLQLHGNYTAEDFARARAIFPRVWWATSLDRIAAEHPNDLKAGLRVGTRGEELLLLDAPTAGSGERWDVSRIVDNQPDGRWLLAGGLTPDNVAAAVAAVRPSGVDVSSGVESAPGVKDLAKIRAFVRAARNQS